jgi:lipopolysaccharide biosynthesis glycosyltransferase
MVQRDAIVMIADDRQFPPAMFLAARLRQLRGARDLDIVVASSAKQALASAAGFDPAIALVDLTAVEPERDLPVYDYLTRATYLRLFVPRLLEGRYRRILYLDNDCYPEGDALFGLFDLDMGEYTVAGVRDLHVPFIPNEANAAELAVTLGVTGRGMAAFFGARYLNNGVLLIDIDGFHRARIEKKTMQYLQAHPRPLNLEQTLLNGTLRGRWLELSPRFNFVAPALATFIAAFVRPSIIHFTGAVKPWHAGFRILHPVRAEMTAFLKGSPWSTFLQQVNPVVLGGAPLQQTTGEPPWRAPAIPNLVRYLGETPFADVAQGLTTPDPAALADAGLAGSPSA